MNIIYIKTKGMKTFKTFDIERGITVQNVIYASSIEDTDKNRKMLQEIADENNKLDVTFQLRNNGKVVFQTK